MPLNREFFVPVFISLDRMNSKKCIYSTISQDLCSKITQRASLKICRIWAKPSTFQEWLAVTNFTVIRSMLYTIYYICHWTEFKEHCVYYYIDLINLKNESKILFSKTIQIECDWNLEECLAEESALEIILWIIQTAFKISPHFMRYFV